MYQERPVFRRTRAALGFIKSEYSDQTKNVMLTQKQLLLPNLVLPLLMVIYRR